MAAWEVKNLRMQALKDKGVFPSGLRGPSVTEDPFPRENLGGDGQKKLNKNTREKKSPFFGHGKGQQKYLGRGKVSPLFPERTEAQKDY